LQSPIANRQSPIANRQPPITTHHLARRRAVHRQGWLWFYYERDAPAGLGVHPGILSFLADYVAHPQPTILSLYRRPPAKRRGPRVDDDEQPPAASPEPTRAAKLDKDLAKALSAYDLLLHHIPNAAGFLATLNRYKGSPVSRAEDLLAKIRVDDAVQPYCIFNVLTPQAAIARLHLELAESSTVDLRLRSTTDVPIVPSVHLRLLYYRPPVGLEREQAVDAQTNTVHAWFVAEHAGVPIPDGVAPRPYDASATVCYTRSKVRAIGDWRLAIGDLTGVTRLPAQVHPLGDTVLVTMMPHFTPLVDFSGDDFAQFVQSVHRREDLEAGLANKAPTLSSVAELKQLSDGLLFHCSHATEAVRSHLTAISRSPGSSSTSAPPRSPRSTRVM
jgi:hypothetical protein